MLKLITGTVGCGKTAYVHSLIARMVKEESREVILLVPEQFTHESELGLTTAAGPAVSSSVPVYSFERLADAVFELCGRPLLPSLGKGGEVVFMSQALQELSGNLHVYGGQSEQAALTNGLLDAADELKKCSIGSDTLRDIAHRSESRLFGEKLSELALIFDTYETLISRSFFNGADKLTILAEKLKSYRFFAGKTVFLDGFRRFTGQEFAVLGQILSQAEDVYAAFTCDGLSVLPGEANAFTAVKMTARRLCDEAKRQGVAVASETRVTEEAMSFRRYFAPELAYLEKALFQEDADAYEADAPAVTVCAAKNRTEECEWAARQIKKLMRTDFCRCRDISVIYRSDGVYERELKYALKKYGVPMFEDERQPITDQPLICYVNNLLSVCADGFSSDRLMHMAKTGLSLLSVEEWSELENYVFMWDIDGKDWEREWTANPDGYGVELTEERSQRLLRINEERKSLVEPIRELRQRLKDASGKEICALLFTFLTENGCVEALARLAGQLSQSGENAVAAEQGQVLTLFSDCLDQLARAFGESKVSVKRFSQLLDAAVSRQTLGRIPTGFDEVAFGTATRLQRRMSKVVFALGMNDGVFPLPPSSSGIFTDPERLEMEEYSVELAKNSRTHILDEKFIVYNTLCSARDKLFVSYAMTDGSSQRLQKSETVRRLLSLFPHLNRVTAEAEGMERVESDESAFELMGELWKEASPLGEGLKEYFSSREDYAGKLAAIRRAAEKAPFSLKAENAARLFGERLYITPSRADSFEKCPFRFFCEYGLRACSRKKAALDPMQSGNIIHAALEHMLKKFPANGLREADEEDLQQEIHAFIVEYADRLLGGYALLTGRVLFHLGRIEKTVLVVLRRLSEEFWENGFAPHDFELHIGRDSAIREFTVPLENGRSISIFGVIDRVDLMKKDGKAYIRVIDYKSGPKDFQLSDILNGMNMQLLMYLMALWNNGKEYYGGEIVPCGVFYLPARFLPFDAERSGGEEALTRKVMKNGRMNGLVLDDAETVSAMAAGDFTFLPVSVKKDGSLSGNLIDIVTMAKLKKKITDILRDLGEELLSGYIPAKPVNGKNYGDVCETCDFRSVCAHEKDGDYRNIGFSKHEECIERLKEVEIDEP